MDSFFASILSGMTPGRRLAATEIDGLKVSTVVTTDMGPETAICDANGAHPVERYSSVDAATDGHEAWCEKVRAGLTEVTELGYGDYVQSKPIVLQRTAVTA